MRRGWSGGGVGEVGGGERASLARALSSWVSRRAISLLRDCSSMVGVVIGGSLLGDRLIVKWEFGSGIPLL